MVPMKHNMKDEDDRTLPPIPTISSQGENKEAMSSTTMSPFPPQGLPLLPAFANVSSTFLEQYKLASPQQSLPSPSLARYSQSHPPLPIHQPHPVHQAGMMTSLFAVPPLLHSSTTSTSASTYNVPPHLRHSHSYPPFSTLPGPGYTHTTGSMPGNLTLNSTSVPPSLSSSPISLTPPTISESSSSSSTSGVIKLDKKRKERASSEENEEKDRESPPLKKDTPISRKDYRKAVEKRRRTRIRTCIDNLREVVPSCKDDKVKKVAVLQKAVEYILQLKKENQTLSERLAELQSRDADQSHHDHLTSSRVKHEHSSTNAKPQASHHSQLEPYSPTHPQQKK